jgi:hypothetical protein
LYRVFRKNHKKPNPNHRLLKTTYPMVFMTCLQFVYGRRSFSAWYWWFVI